MKHVVVGTAGHIDHGKTSLVKALTGIDTDRLPEEKARGISIDLGYAPLDLPGGRRLSVIDVPGHERFIRNMVAGASGIDLFLLVIDATEGARPQTHEHLAILRLLGIDAGVVAVTKADAADPAMLELVTAEARELVPEAEVVPVSAKTGDGLDELRSALAAAADEHERGTLLGATRLYVDRVFTLRGIGTVVTGTLWSGSIGEGDELRAEPAGLDVRVRSVQVHDQPVTRAEAGQRVAVALPGVERNALHRGDALVEPGAYPVSYRLDIELEELEAIPDHAPLQLHHGTAELPARLVRVGERFAQLRLAGPSSRPVMTTSCCGPRPLSAVAVSSTLRRLARPTARASSCWRPTSPSRSWERSSTSPFSPPTSPRAHCCLRLSSPRAWARSSRPATGTSRASGWSRFAARRGRG